MFDSEIGSCKAQPTTTFNKRTQIPTARAIATYVDGLPASAVSDLPVEHLHADRSVRAQASAVDHRRKERMHREHWSHHTQHVKKQHATRQLVN
jgi:hypothetical protein